MKTFFNKLFRLVSLMITITFALSFSLLCFEAFVWFAAKITPDTLAVISERTVMHWFAMVFDPTWITCMVTAIVITILGSFPSKKAPEKKF